MKKSKLFLLSTASLISVFSLTSCGTASSNITIGICCPSSDEWNTTLQADYKAYAEKKGVKLILNTADGDTNKQISNTEALIAQKPDCIILRGIDNATAESCCNLITAAKIKCVIDAVAPTTSKDYTALVSNNIYNGGRKIGDYFVSLLKADASLNIKMAYIDGSQSTVIQARYLGITQVLTENNLIDRYSLVHKELGKWDATTAQTLTEGWISTYTSEPFNFIASSNDTMSLAAYTAVSTSKMTDKIKVIGYDGDSSAQTSIRKGQMTGSVYSDINAWGIKVMDTAISAAKGEAIEGIDENKKVIESNEVFITKDNIDSVVGA